MTIDALSLAAIRSETDQLVRGCRVQKIIPTGPLSLVLETYNPTFKQRVQFLLSADAQNARFHLLSQKASQMPGQPNHFLLLLRKYVRYGIISGIEQTPFERIVTVSIAKKFPAGKRPHFEAASPDLMPDEHDDDERDEAEGDDDASMEIYESKIVCEMMGRHSNIALLSEDGLIVDAIKRVGTGKNRYRVILPHQPYVTPPPQDKRRFHLESPASFARLMDGLRQANPKAALWQTLVSTFSGASPQLGREIAYRLAERKGQKLEEATLDSFQRWDSLYSELRTLLAPLNPNTTAIEVAPSVVRETNGTIVAFAPYPLYQFRADGLEPEAVPTVSLAAEEYFSQTEAVGGQAQRKQEIANWINEAADKLQRKIGNMEQQLKRAESTEELRRKGEAIYAQLYEIAPGQSVLETDGLKIALDTDRTPSENAQSYFREYDKGRQAMAGVPELLAETQQEYDYLQEMLTQLELAENYDEIMYIKGELGEAGYGAKVKASSNDRRPKKRKLPNTPTYTSSDGFTIYVGKSAQHNEYVTFELGERGDLWLHARGMPGSHVIIKTGGRDVPDSTLNEAAALAAYYSKGQASTNVEVTYAPQRYIRKVKGLHPGLVTYSNDKSVSVKPKKLIKK